MASYVHVLQNPIKVITVEGSLGESSSSWIKPFAKPNANIFNGVWLIGLKSFSYNIEKISNPRRILNVHSNIVTGFEQNSSESAKHCNPIIAQVHMSNHVLGMQNKEFITPSFFVINNVCDVLELDFSYFQTEKEIPFPETSKNIKFKAVFHYVCQTNS